MAEGHELPEMTARLNLNASDLEHPFQTIPQRVKYNKSFKVDASKVPGAGRGIIVLEDIKAGELIFEIKEPMFTIVRISTPIL
jgi:hypothetical protein